MRRQGTCIVFLVPGAGVLAYDTTCFGNGGAAVAAVVVCSSIDDNVHNSLSFNFLPQTSRLSKGALHERN